MVGFLIKVSRAKASVYVEKNRNALLDHLNPSRRLRRHQRRFIAAIAELVGTIMRSRLGKSIQSLVVEVAMLPMNQLHLGMISRKREAS